MNKFQGGACVSKEYLACADRRLSPCGRVRSLEFRRLQQLLRKREPRHEASGTQSLLAAGRSRLYSDADLAALKGRSELPRRPLNAPHYLERRYLEALPQAQCFPLNTRSPPLTPDNGELGIMDLRALHLGGPTTTGCGLDLVTVRRSGLTARDRGIRADLGHGEDGMMS